MMIVNVKKQCFTISGNKLSKEETLPFLLAPELS